MLWIAQFFSTVCGGIQGSNDKESKDPRIQDLKGRLLREEGRSGTAALVGAAEPVGAETHLAADEAEERRAREVAIGVRREIVSSAVDMELFPLDLPFGMSQKHAPHSERTETELDAAFVHHFTGPVNRAVAVTETELARDDQDVVSLLLVAELPERLHRLDALTQVLRTGLSFAVVVKLPLGRDHREYLIDGLAVGRRELLPPRDGEPSFGVRGKWPAGDTLVERGVFKLREELTQDRDLLRDRLRPLILLRVCVVGADLLFGEPVAPGECTDGCHDVQLELVAVLDEILKLIFVELDLRESLVSGVLDEPLVLLLLTCGDLSDRCFHRHPPSFFRFVRVALTNGFPLYEVAQ